MFPWLIELIAPKFGKAIASLIVYGIVAAVIGGACWYGWYRVHHAGYLAGVAEWKPKYLAEKKAKDDANDHAEKADARAAETERLRAIAVEDGNHLKAGLDTCNQSVSDAKADGDARTARALAQRDVERSRALRYEHEIEAMQAKRDGPPAATEIASCREGREILRALSIDLHHQDDAP